MLPPIDAGPLQEFDVCVYQAARRHRRTNVKLPLPQFRKKDGKLYAQNPANVPAIVEPTHPIPPRPLLLGTVLLPVHGVNKDRLRKLNNILDGPLEWSSTSERAYSYVFPQPYDMANSYAEHLTPDAFQGVATWQAVFNGDIPVQLSLGGKFLNDAGEGKKHTTELPAVTVRQGKSWVSQFLGALGALNNEGVVQPRFTLFKEDEDVEKTAVNVGGASGSGLKREREDPRKHSKSLPEEEEEREADVGGSSAKKAKLENGSKGALSGRKSTTPADKGDLPGGSSAIPTHVKVEVYLAAEALSNLYQGGPEATSNTTARNQSLSFWRSHTNAMSVLLSTLLCHGEGLSVGPDSDGLLNYCDSSQEELKDVDALSTQELRAQFNVSKILSAVGPSHSQRHGDKAEESKYAPRPKDLRTEPKNYQLAGLKWMLDREIKGDAVRRGHALLHPAWVQLISAKGHVFYCQRMKCHVLTERFFTAPTVGTCGGFICDEMGLGKSLQTLMLVLENKPQKGWAVDKISNEQLVTRTEPIPIKTTLLVAPTTLLSQWEEEIEKHLHNNALRWGRFVDPSNARDTRALMQAWRNKNGGQEAGGNVEASGSMVRPRRRPANGEEARKKIPPGGQFVRQVLCTTGRNGDPAELHTLDLCLCSYEDLRVQLGSAQGFNMSLLQQFGFWRVCLDEAQLIANTSSVAAIMASSLWRRHAWVVTGTPITAKLSEVRGLLEFLALEPIYHNEEWAKLVQHGCDKAQPHGLLTLRSLLRGVMLRRSKEDVGKLDIFSIKLKI